MCFYGFWCSSSWLSFQSSNVGETQSAQKFRIVSLTSVASMEKKLKVLFEKLKKQVMSLVNQWNAGSKVLIPMEMPIFWLDQRIHTVYKFLFSLYLVKWTDFIEKLVMQMANNPLNSRHYFKKTFEPFISIKSPHSQQKIFFGLLLKIFFWKTKGLIR